MSLTFKRTGDEDYPRHLKVLVQGQPKSGKTTFASTAPNCVFLALPDAGLMSIAHKNVPYREIEDVQELMQIQLMLSDKTMRERLARSLGLPDIETVVIDTLDSLQEMQKKAILKANRSSEMRQADWGKLKELLAAIVKAYVALPINVIFTVHTTTMQDDEQRIIQVPALQGGIKDEIAGWVDFSLLAERRREIGADGKPFINFVLKAEGDQKNPHLGNRAAGRLPEYIQPDFQILHDGVFSALDNIVKTQIIDNVEVPAEQPIAEEESALPESRKLAEKVVAETKAPTPVATPVAPAATSTAAPDASEHINTAGMRALTKSITDLNLSLPEFDQEVWTLGFAREVARFIAAAKADEKLGRGNAADEVLAYLDGFGVKLFKANYASTATPSLPVKEIIETPKKTTVRKAEVTAASNAGTPDTDAAVATLEQQVGAVVIGEKLSADAACAECGNPVDDVDIATLAHTRYRRPLCTKDYLALNRAAK